MAKFKIIAGRYDGKRKGDEVESDDPLDEMFENKFERVNEATRKSRDAAYDPDSSGRVMDDRQEEDVEKVKKAVRGAKGEDRSKSSQGERYRGGEERLEEGKKGKKSKKGSEDEEQDFGADVTDQFQKATDKGLTVFKDTKGFTVVKDGKKVSDKPVKNKKDVNAFLKRQPDPEAEEEDEKEEG